MATNPMFHTNDSPNNATQPTKAVNRQSVSINRTHNTFDLSYPHEKSQKFGQYEPFFVMEGVPGDFIPYSNSHNVRSLPFSSPILSSIKLHKDYFLVPNNAIQPQTWDYIFKNPAQGDDVPVDAQNIFPFVSSSGAYSFSHILDSIVSINNSIFNGEANDDAKVSLFYLLMLSENFFSSGSLLYQLGYKLNPIFQEFSEADGYTYNYSFDTFFDSIMRNFSGIRISIDFDGPNGEVISRDFATGYNYYDNDKEFQKVDLYTLLSLFRSYSSRITSLSIYEYESPYSILRVSNLPSVSVVDRSIRMDRVCAYQLACSQYYVNPQVDFIYNAQLYRDNFLSNLRETYNLFTDQPLPIGFFEMNGINVPFDCFSQYYYRILNSLLRDAVDYAVFSVNNYSERLFSLYGTLSYLFSFRETLKFGDYFTDSRTQPLAYGENGSDLVSVMDDSVSVIDMSQKIILQRYRNAVVKLGNNGGDYLRGIFGEEQSPDFHVPKFIIHTEFGVNGEEINNTTSDNQGNIVTNLKSGDDTFVFEIDVNMPCIIIGISHISMPRSYMQTKERFFFHKDRFDMFNPMLQYFGDQEIYNIERSDKPQDLQVFAYQSRNSEYKQRFGQVSGAFTDLLKSWVFVTDSLDPATSELVLTEHQSPDFIRAHDYEFNRFLTRMSGVSLSHGFHFMIVYHNKCVCNRPMEINPSTL